MWQEGLLGDLEGMKAWRDESEVSVLLAFEGAEA